MKMILTRPMYTDIPFHFTYFIIVSSGREDNLTASWTVIPGILREIIGRLLDRNINFYK